MKKIFLALVLFLAAPVFAEEAPAKPWSDKAGFSFLSANGNSDSRTLGASNEFQWKKEPWTVEQNMAALNVQNDDLTETERYKAGEKVRWNWSPRNYVFERFQWESDRFAGYRHRYDATSGVGRTFIQTKHNELLAEVGAGYLNEQRIAERVDFGSGRAYSKYILKMSDSSQASQDAEYLHHFGEPNDYRLNTESAVTAAVSTHLSLKLSYTWKHVQEPPAGFKRDDALTLISLLVNY